jgi:hypothetical protein
MNKCSVCEKVISEPATECSTKCVLEASQRGQQAVTKARSSFSQAFQKMFIPDTGRLPELPEVPMFYVKHRWMKNRNLVHGSLILSFNDKGYAAVQNLGNNRVEAESVVKWSRGLMQICDSVDMLKAEVEAEVPKPAPVPEKVVPVKVPEEGVAVVEEPAVKKMKFSAKKTTKKKTTKKTVGKKSSKK